MGFYDIVIDWRTFGVKAPATMGDIIPGIVAIVFDRPNIIPAYLKKMKWYTKNKAQI